MFYWLFSEVSAIVHTLLLPLICSSLVIPIATAFLLGVGIRRSADDDQQSASGRLMQIGVSFSYGIVALTVTSLYLNLFSDLAIAVARGRNNSTGLIQALVGAPANINTSRLFMFGMFLILTNIVAVIGLRSGLRDGGWLRERVDRLRVPRVKRGALGSSHFCTMREYRRFRRIDREGLVLFGAFWGENKHRLDFGTGQFCLGGEDVARGILTLGGPGSGKTQGIILPAIADRMLLGHSLIVADPQGEITDHILKYAAATQHLVIVHDPTSTSGPRYNLAEEIDNVSDARAIADVLVPSAHGDNRFWTDSAAALLAACLIRFDNLGDIYSAMNDLKQLSDILKSKKDDAALLANSFISSVGSDGKVAANVIATLATALTGWASTDVRANTSVSDFDAELIVTQPTIVVLTCPGRMRAVYASYLGATLRKLMLDLDTIGERNNGPLPVPVGVILDEFPTLGKLDSLVADINLVRKRRISVLIGAQTKGQFEMIYGREGTQALFTGLATQIVYGGCDADTAEFYSKASGTATTDANIDDPNSHLRQRPLLTVDEVITPQIGNCTIFARYIEPGFATQVVLNARLTRFYERQDWKQRLAGEQVSEPLILGRGIDLVLSSDNLKPDMTQPAVDTASSIERAARNVLATLKEVPEQKSDEPGKRITANDVRARRKSTKLEIDQ